MSHPMENHTDWTAFLSALLEEFACQTGTIHRTAPDGRSLTLICQVGVPDSLLEKISAIPFGKGIAGAAAESRHPVRLCNLQQDLGGIAKPDARKTGVSGSLAVPVMAAGTDQVIGTLGIGMTIPYDFSADEEGRLQEHARNLAILFENKGFRDD